VKNEQRHGKTQFPQVIPSGESKSFPWEEKFLEQIHSDKKDKHSKRLARVRAEVEAQGLDGVILVPGPNLRYISGVSSLLFERPFILFVPVNGDAHLVSPTLESGPYLRNSLNIVVHKWDDEEGPQHALEDAVNQLSLNGSWGVEGRVPFRFIHLIMKHAQVQLKYAESILQEIREIKEPDEIARLQRSAKILAQSFMKLPSLIKAGVTELEVARKFSQVIYSHGAESVDEILVQSGKFAADPHHLASSKKLKRNESIVIDTACRFDGYNADITRSFIIGKDRRFEETYDAVLSSEKAAIKASRAGETVGSIDETARGYLRGKGLDGYFIHRTGHGLGLEVHEAPYIVPRGSEILRSGMVFTIEPGVYIPEKLGVRIEDNVLATESKSKNLTSALPKDFGWWR